MLTGLEVRIAAYLKVFEEKKADIIDWNTFLNLIDTVTDIFIQVHMRFPSCMTFDIYPLFSVQDQTLSCEDVILKLVPVLKRENNPSQKVRTFSFGVNTDINLLNLTA